MTFALRLTSGSVGTAPAERIDLIHSLSLTDFRSYAGARLEMTSGPVVLHGPNGAGKTNLLEAIRLLTPGKGLRGATAAEMGRREPGEATGRAWAVMVELDDETRLGTGVQAAARRGASCASMARRPSRGGCWTICVPSGPRPSRTGCSRMRGPSG